MMYLVQILSSATMNASPVSTASKVYL
jgi:hypothetical protein